jgi:hypothetical protein
VVAVHERAVRRLFAGMPEPRRIAIVGGGLFPRTALVVHAVWPEAKVVLIDADAGHLDRCRRWLRGDEALAHAWVCADSLPEADLVFVPLAFDHEKSPLYAPRKDRTVIIHEWIWNRRNRKATRTAIASFLLLKRLNLVTE